MSVSYLPMSRAALGSSRAISEPLGELAEALHTRLPLVPSPVGSY